MPTIEIALSLVSQHLLSDLISLNCGNLRDLQSIDQYYLKSHVDPFSFCQESECYQLFCCIAIHILISIIDYPYLPKVHFGVQ
jgi:hypothetical protein